jgi:hypothetical protein
MVDSGLYLYIDEPPVTEVEGLNPCLADANHKLSPVTKMFAFLNPTLEANELGTAYDKRTLFNAM